MAILGSDGSAIPGNIALLAPPLSEDLRDFPLSISLCRTEKCFTLFLATLQDARLLLR